MVPEGSTLTLDGNTVCREAASSGAVAAATKASLHGRASSRTPAR